ncbi:hypothetical protein QFZ24_009977 [Streptomyces phaeochromogenes]|jgi:hypothetical protein|nr:hypothetical protein [Streptomyces phaeochromogenes]
MTDRLNRERVETPPVISEISIPRQWGPPTRQMRIWSVELCLGLLLAAGVLVWLAAGDAEGAVLGVAGGVLGVALRSRSAIRYLRIRSD